MGSRRALKGSQKCVSLISEQLGKAAAPQVVATRFGADRVSASQEL